MPRDCTRASTIAPLQRRISFPRHFLTVIVALFPAVIHSVPNHDFRIRQVCEHTSRTLSQPNSHSESNIFSLLGPFRARIHGAGPAGAVFTTPTALELWPPPYSRLQPYGYVNVLGGMAHHGCEARSAAVALSSSPLQQAIGSFVLGVPGLSL